MDDGVDRRGDPARTSVALVGKLVHRADPPTEEEWQEFLGHFERRKVSVGTCGRAFATPCIHEHACVRCALLWPDPAQKGRLVDIRDNIVARITEARREGWLGEVEGLEVSLAGAEDKLSQLERRSVQLADEALLAAKPR